MQYYDYAFPPSVAQLSDGRVLTGDAISHGGMDIRTYIATAALQGLLACSSDLHEVHDVVEYGEDDDPSLPSKVYAMRALVAVQHADALIAELNKPKEVQP